MTLGEQVREKSAKIANFLRRLIPASWRSSTPNPSFAAALGHWSTASSDIHDHLGTIFYEAISAHPRLIVELGTRDGVSTRALLAAAEVTGAHVLSIDIRDCSKIDLPAQLLARWTFMCADDVDFAGKPFDDFCTAHGLPATADVILVDTSHLYEHTCAEIERWVPRLSPRGVMLFHDTNMAIRYRRLDGRVRQGADNDRGVIRAIEKLLARRYDEKTFFTDVTDEYLIQHVPWSSGFLVLRRRNAGGSP